MASELDLHGKVAIVTGAGRGIGRVIALTLSAHGAKVVINDIQEAWLERVADEIRRGGGEVLAVKADVRDYDAVSRMVQETLEKFGTVDILVNNAGALRPTALEEISTEEWDLIIDTNMKGTFNCTKAVLGLMKEKRSGRIVNMSSSAGKSTSTFGGAHYTSAKAGILGLTRHTAREAAPYGINVNAVCPGAIDTEMVRGSSTPEELAEIVSKIPLGRIGTPQDVANVVLFLVSDLSSYITGAAIDVNAGDLMV